MLAGFQVAMNHLLVVHVFQGVHQFVGYLVRHFRREQLLVYQILQRVAIYVFHHDGSAQVLHFFHAYGMADVGVLQLQTYLEFLGQCLSVDGRIEEVVLRAFQYVALAVSCGCEDAGVPRDGDVALAEVAELRLYRLGFGNVHLLVDIFRESRCCLHRLI